MTPEESVDLLWRLLSDSGFDAERPQLATFWRAFKEWVCQSVDCDSDKVFVSLGYDERRGFGYAEFCRDFDHDRDEWDFDVTMRFHSVRPDTPQLAVVGVQSESLTGRPALLASAEQLPEFKAAIAYRNWEFEAYRE